LNNINNKFCHLTNYSINKKNKNFIINKDIKNDNVGNKWSIKSLNIYL